MKIIILFVVFVISFNACGFINSSAVKSNSVSGENTETAPIDPEAADRSAETPLNNEIRKVDFKNFTYQPYCAGPDEPTKVTVKNGEFSEEKKVDDFTERFYFEVFSIIYGDVNGDRSEDAVILTVCNTGGTGNFSEGFIYEMKNGQPALVARIPGGDRAYGGLREARIENGLLVVESNDVGEMGGACCPEYIVTTKYRLRGDKLEQSGAESKREIYPAKRVEFSKGASKSTFTINLNENEDLKRFVVGARRGQTLTVTAVPGDRSKTIEVSLFKGEADANETDHRLTARLKENGDYVIQIRGFTEQEMSVSVTIEIK